MNGPRPGIIWTDELWDYYKGVQTGDYARSIFIGGRGSGKTYLQQKLIELHEQAKRVIDAQVELWNIIDDALMRPAVIPEVEEFFWVCRPPTQMPAPGSALWYQEQATKFLRGGLA